MTLLQLSGLSRQFGGLNALTDINLSVEPGEVIALLARANVEVHGDVSCETI